MGNLEGKSKKGTKAIESGKKFIEYFKKEFGSKDSSSSSSSSNKKTIKSFGKLIEEAFPAVGDAWALIDVFVGGGNRTPTEPTVISFEAGLNFNIEGSISTSRTLAQKAIYTPGSYQGNSVTKPVYNNTLGIFNVLKTPKIEVTYQPYERGYYGFYKCNISEDLSYVINPTSGLSTIPENLKIALFFKFKDPSDIVSRERINLIKITDSLYRTPYFNPSCLENFPAKFVLNGASSPEEHFEEIDITLHVVAELKRLDDNEDTDHVLFISRYKTEITNYRATNSFSSGLTSHQTLSSDMVGDYISAYHPAFMPQYGDNPYSFYKSDEVINEYLEADETIFVFGRATLGNIKTNGYKLTIIASEGIEIPDGMDYNPDIHIELGYPSECDRVVPAQTPAEVTHFCNNSYNPVAAKEQEPPIVIQKEPIEENTIPFTAYPNPFKDNVIISYELEEASMVNLSIQNALGQVVKVIYDSDSQDDGQHTKTINTENLANGVYFAVLQIDGHTQTTKIIKQ